MLDIKSQSQLAEATADMMRACALATARAASSSMFQGMSFWSRMLSPVPVLPAAWPVWGQAFAAQAQQPAEADKTEAAAETGFSSYRSAGGHAVAQVVMG